MLELIGVNSFYGSRQALWNINVTVGSDEVVAVLGANGAGKTTLLRSIMGLIHTKGKISFDGDQISNGSVTTIARRGIAMVSEGRGTFGELTVEENLSRGRLHSKRQETDQDRADQCLQPFSRIV